MQIGPSRSQARPSRQGTSVAQSLLKGQELTSLTDKERDEIDFEAKTIIRQTMDRVKTMENLENGSPSAANVTHGKSEEAEPKRRGFSHAIWWMQKRKRGMRCCRLIGGLLLGI